MKKRMTKIIMFMTLIFSSTGLTSCNLLDFDMQNSSTSENSGNTESQGISVINGADGKDGVDGQTPYIGPNGNWWIGKTDLGVSAQGIQGPQGEQGIPGTNGSDGKDGTDGKDGIDGKDGTSLLTGEGLPDVSLGKNGDSYIDVNTWNYYSKINGEWIFINNMNNTNHTHTFVSNATNSTCNESGSVILTCTTCGHVESSVIPPTGHTFGAWIETKSPTCEEEGLKKRVCFVCKYVEEGTIPAHEHEYTNNYLYDSSTHWNMCTHCGVRYNEESHIVGDTSCSSCGYRFPSSYPVDGDSAGLIFALTDDETSYILIDIGTFEGTELIIPSTYNDKPVTGIVEGFAGGNEIKSIVFPDTITKLPNEGLKGLSSLENVVLPSEIKEIPFSFFYGCNSLTSIVIPKGVTSIGDYAFNCCSSLTSITIPEGVTRIGNYVFSYCYNLTSIVIPEGVTSIESCAFFDCSKLTNITIPSSVARIGDNAFFNCSSLTSITIPEGVTRIGYDAFNYCNSLKNAIFENVSNWYADGKIYKEQLENPATAAKLLTSTKSSKNWCCAKLVYRLNENKDGYVVNFTNGDYSDVTSIVIPSTYNDLPVTSIGEDAFNYCYSLISITIPDSVTSIGDYAFSDCSSFQKVYYKGTTTDWNNITISFGNYGLTYATIYYYSENEPSDTTNKYWHYVEGEVVVWD